MPSLPRDDDNLISGLADFWVSFFKDTDFTRAYFQGGQMMLGQVYLELLQAVLGVSLNHIPLFSKRYFKFLPVREDQVAFIEGATTADDRWAYDSGENVSAVTSILNKVVAPTRTLDSLIDYEVADGLVQFKVDPFNSDGSGGTIAQFPVRTVQVLANASVLNPRGVDWRSLGVLPGDTFWFAYPPNLPPKVVQVKATDGIRLMLSDNLQEFGTDLRGRSFKLHVVRIPFDRQKAGIPTPGQDVAFAPVGLLLNSGTTSATVTSPPAGLTATPGQFVYVSDAGEPRNSGYYNLLAIGGGPTWTLSAPANFRVSAGPVTAYLADHGPVSSSLFTPTFPFPNTLIDQGSLFVSGRRAAARVLYGTTTPLLGSSNYAIDVVANTVTYPANEDVQEGVDYVVDYFNGLITYLTVWNPAIASYSTYSWKLLVATESITYRQSFSAVTVYNAGDQVLNGGNYFISRAGSAAHAFNIGEWLPFNGPFAGDNTFQLRELGAWGVDQLVDQDALYENFGYLLGFKKATSEQYRQFLRGVSQLFLLGPSLGRFESVLNVCAGLPVVRDDGEILQAYDSGYVNISSLSDITLGDGGSLIDSASGSDGTLASGPSTFSSPTANFLPSDIGAVLRIEVFRGFTEFAITAVSVDGTTATIAPAPPDATGVAWDYQHAIFRQRFRVASNNVTYLFTESDVDGEIVISNAYDARDIGSFRIAAVIGPRELVLESQYGFADASGLSWRFTRTRQQVVTTSRTRYKLPVTVPIRADIADPVNVGLLKFIAFEPLSSAIQVVDYVSDPTWWHHVGIPKELMVLATDSAGRRQVTPQLIPHIVNAFDGAVINDFGLFAGLDENGEPGIARQGEATWLGGPWVRLDFAIGTTVPPARLTDVNQYVSVPSGKFKGYFQILGISLDGTQVRLDRFPPPEADGLVAPVSLPQVKLPPIVYRRTVAFVVFDKFLKWHSMQVRLSTFAGLDAEFISDAAQVLRDGKPAHVYCYFEPSTSFSDQMTLTDTLAVAYGPEFVDHVHVVDNDFTGMTRDIVGEYHAITDQTQAAAPGAGPLTFIVSPTFAYSPDRYVILFGRFQTGTSGGKPLDIGYNCTFDMTTGSVNVPAYDGGAYSFRYVVAALRQHAYSSTAWWSTGATNGETPSCVHGPDVMITGPQVPLTAGEYGLIDRPLEVTIS